MTNPTSASPAPRSNARGEATRSRLLEAALASFASRGFHGTGTRDIAEQAGMSPAAVYVHYRTKEELLFALSLAGHLDSRAVVDQAAQLKADHVSRFREAIRSFTAWHAENHVTARVVQYEMSALTPEHTADIVAIRRHIEDVVTGLIEAGVENGDFHVPSPRVASLAVLSLGIDVARWFRPDGLWSPVEIGDHFATLGLQLVGHYPCSPAVVGD